MKTKIVIILLAFAFVLPIQNAQSDILATYLFGLNVKYGEGLFQDDYYSMYAQANTTHPDDEVYLYNVPGQENPLLVPFARQVPSGQYQMLKRFIAPPPGDEWAGAYEYYLGTDPFSNITIDIGDIYQLDTVGNPEVSGGNHPTITWDAIPDPSVISYSVRIYGLLDNGKQDGSNFLFETSFPGNDDSYSYTYNGDLFVSNEPLVIDIVAVAPIPSWSPPKEIKINASNYFIKHFADTDLDNADGISDRVDADPVNFSNQFNFAGTSGEILSRGNQTIEITAAADPEEDVLMAVYGGTRISPAIISVCDGETVYTIEEDSIFIVTCGSVITRVTRGVVKATFTATDGTIATADIPDGNKLVFDPDDFNFTADENNLETIVVYIDDIPVPVDPGMDKTIVQIDIKPGSDTNCFNQNEKGVIPVTIFGRADLNVRDIDVETLSLQGLSVKMAGKSNRDSAHYEDVNNDSFLDLILQFEDSDQWVNSGSEFATLTGTVDGSKSIEGSDIICIVPQKNK